MLEFLRTSGKHSDRRARLYAVACCRRIWGLLGDERSRRAVEVAERYADERATFEEVLRVEAAAWYAAADAAFVPTGAAAWARAVDAGLDPGTDTWHLAAQAWCSAADAAWGASGACDVALATVDPVANRALAVPAVEQARANFQAAAVHREDGRRIARLAAAAARTAADGRGDRRAFALALAEQARAHAQAAERAPVRDARAAALAAWAAAEAAGGGLQAAEAPAEGVRQALDGSHAGESSWRCELLRCLFGDSFHPPPPASPAWIAWSNSTIPRLPEAAYNERQLPAGTLDVVRLAVLADALEEAGCGDTDLLAHLRHPGLHWRGCFALDLVLGKS
jgi:hypothetical protein